MKSESLLFTLGPVPMYARTLAVGGTQVPYFRTGEFSKTVSRIEHRFNELVGAPSGSRTILLTSSGTGAMEAAIVNCLAPTDQALVINGGTFGQRFVDLCEHHGIATHVLRVPFGETLTPDLLAGVDTSDLTALLVNIHETSTGQLYNAELLAEFASDHNLIFIVDSISSFLADDLDMEALGIDVLINSSQKALALSPGLSIVTLAPRALRLLNHSHTAPQYFDFASYLTDGERGQTPFTPAVGIVLELADRLEMIEGHSLAGTIADTESIAMDFRKKVAKLPVEIPDYPLSNAATPIVFPNGGADRVFRELIANFGYYVNPNGGELADTVLRVGHIGQHTVEENSRLVNALKQLLEGN